MKLTEIEKAAKEYQVAKMLAAAYWRGRLAHMENDMKRSLFEYTIEHAAETDYEKWQVAARIFDDI